MGYGPIITGNRRSRVSLPMRSRTSTGGYGLGATRTIRRPATRARTAGRTTGRTVTVPQVARGSRKSLKSRGGSSTVTRKKRVYTDKGNMSDYSKVAVTYGKPLSLLMKTMKLVSGATELTRWSWRNLNKFGGTQGAVKLQSIQPGLAGTIMYMPVHCYDLTSVLNNNDTTSTTPNVAYELRFSNDTAAHVASWGVFQNNNLTTTWTSIDAPTTTPAKLEGGTAYLNTVDVKLLLYGATAQPNKFQIDLCQFDQDFVPDTGGTVQVPVTSTMTADHTAFWEYMTKRWCFNPIDTENTKFRKNWKILKSMVIEMDAKETTEGTQNRYKEVRMFYRMNRKLNYRWLENDTAALTNTDTQTNTAQNQCYVQQKARVYLMIRALNPVVFPSGVSTVSNTPSYDIVIEKTHLNLNGNTA